MKHPSHSEVISHKYVESSWNGLHPGQCKEARSDWQSVEVGYLSLYSLTYYGPHVSFILGRGKTSLAEHVTFTSRPLGARVCSNRIDDAGAEEKGKINFNVEVFFEVFFEWLVGKNNQAIRSDKGRNVTRSHPRCLSQRRFLRSSQLIQ